MSARHAYRQQQQTLRGFTLVELLLAVALTAMVGALAYAGISNGMQAATAMATQEEALTDLQRAFDVMESDLTQVRLRPLSLGLGYREAAFTTSNSAGNQVVFTRAGVANPQQLLRSDLQRVRYAFHDGGLWRQYWQQLDRAEPLQAPQEVLLLPGVSQLRFEFLAAVPADSLVSVAALQSEGGLWQRDWDSDAPEHAMNHPLPLAVRVSLQTSQYGQVERVFELP